MRHVRLTAVALVVSREDSGPRLDESKDMPMFSNGSKDTAISDARTGEIK
jgi:hypothetical protein